MSKRYPQRLLLYVTCTLLVISTKAQLIYTVAGSNNPGDYGLATSAAINGPLGTAVDAGGNIYIADRLNHRIRKINASTGEITTIAGSGTSGSSGDGGQATAARLTNPFGVTVDAGGNIYIGDQGNYRIRKVTASTGIITTIAGTGTSGSSGDGGQATAAQVNFASGLAVDADGNVFIADQSNHRIRKITASTGIITTIAGTGTSGSSGDGEQATAAQLSTPQGVALDASGNIYIADRFNHRIRKITASTGVITTIAGTGTSGSSGDGGQATAALVSNPQGIALDANGNIYIGDTGNQRIRKVTASTGIITTIAGTGTSGSSGDGGQATAAQLSTPVGVAVDASGNIYIGNQTAHRVRKITASTGVISTAAGTGIAAFSGDGGQASSAQLNDPWASTVDGSGNVFIADLNNHRIRKITASTGVMSTIAGNGTSGFSGDGGQATAAQLSSPSGVAVDGSGNVYTVDRGTNRIRKITASTGIMSTIAGTGTSGSTGDGGQATAAQISNPFGVAVDGGGNVYIADQNNNRIRKITASTGIMSTIAGTGTSGSAGDGGQATVAQLNNPYGVAVDGSGNVYIAEGGQRIRKITASTGIITTIAGTGTWGFSGDDGQATAAQINSPFGVAVDGSGNVYIVDQGNQRIRKITASTGVITTIAGTGTAGFSGDGGQATAAQLYNPFSVAVDGSGNVYIADRFNNRIRVVCPTSGLPGNFAAVQQNGFSGLNNTLFFNEGCAAVSGIAPSGTNPVMGAIADTVWVETSVPVSGSGKPYVQRHYGITPALNASAATATITLYYTQAEFTAYNAASNHGPNLPVDAADAAGNKANLRIIKRSGTSNNGIGLFDSYSGEATSITPTNVTWNSALNRWEVTFNVTGFSGFFVASGAITVLPLRLLSFNARLVNGDGILTWKTADEQNTALFEIERSLDGHQFSPLASVSAAGTSVNERAYQYTDRQLSALQVPAVYYRLKMVDNNGQFTTSKVVAVNISSRGSAVSLYPNPVQNTATVTVMASRGESLQLRLIDQNGRVVYRKTVMAQAGPNAFVVETASLPAGVYTLSIRGNDTQKELKMIKQ
jgi:invasion protein IalB